MATNYDVLEFALNSLVDKLTERYNINYESAIDAIMNSMVYARLLSDDVFLDEGDIYLFTQLEKELTAKGVIAARLPGRAVVG